MSDFNQVFDIVVSP